MQQTRKRHQMSIWAVRCLDDTSVPLSSPPEHAPKPPPGAPLFARVSRLEHTVEHKSYQEQASKLEQGSFKIASGPLVSDDGSQCIGSMFLVRANSRNDVQEFVQRDPFYVNRVWDHNSITIDRYLPMAGIQKVDPLIKKV
jgi:uncharacterized protein YciI